MDKPAVYAQVRDEQTGAGAVHVAAAEGRATIIKVRSCLESGQHGQPRLRHRVVRGGRFDVESGRPSYPHTARFW